MTGGKRNRGGRIFFGALVRLVGPLDVWWGTVPEGLGGVEEVFAVDEDFAGGVDDVGGDAVVCPEDDGFGVEIFFSEFVVEFGSAGDEGIEGDGRFCAC